MLFVSQCYPSRAVRQRARAGRNARRFRKPRAVARDRAIAVYGPDSRYSDEAAPVVTREMAELYADLQHWFGFRAGADRGVASEWDLAVRDRLRGMLFYPRDIIRLAVEVWAHLHCGDDERKAWQALYSEGRRQCGKYDEQGFAYSFYRAWRASSVLCFPA